MKHLRYGRVFKLKNIVVNGIEVSALPEKILKV